MHNRQILQKGLNIKNNYTFIAKNESILFYLYTILILKMLYLK